MKHDQVGDAGERRKVGALDACFLRFAREEHLAPDMWPLLQSGGQPFAVEQGNSVAENQKAASAGGELAMFFEDIAQIVGGQEFFH